MPLPRKALVSLEATRYYHCVSRCVRRAFLCGADPVSGRSYEHRRGRIEDRLLELTQIFALDVCAYAVMHNHYHVVLYVDREQALGWEDREVITRWHQLFAGNPFSQRFLAGDPLLREEKKLLMVHIREWRHRLMDLSWYMRCLNEAIARQANHEDGCTGRFWEGRFKSQALLDEKALAACMAYVDLNPVRAKVAEAPKTSAHTAIKYRIKKAEQSICPNHPLEQPKDLLPFIGNPRASMRKGLPFRLTDYLELIDWTGRQLRDDKCGVNKEKRPVVLDRLQIDPNQWYYLTSRFESRFKILVGTSYAIKRACIALNKQWAHGIGSSRVLFNHR